MEYRNDLTMASLFDGIGGFPLAAVRHGIVPVWASEIEPFPIRVTKHHFPDMLHMGDITKLDGALLPPVDVVCGGSPCQDLSISNSAHLGLAGERSGLFMEQIRIVKEMRAADERAGGTGQFIRPRFLVWENVPFALSCTGGEDFRTILEEIVRIKVRHAHVPGPHTGRWRPTGQILLGGHFSLAWRCMDAQFWGLAQRRKRLLLVCDFAGTCAPQILFEPESLPGHPAQGEGAGQAPAAPAGAGAAAPGGQHPAAPRHSGLRAAAGGKADGGAGDPGPAGAA